MDKTTSGENNTEVPSMSSLYEREDFVFHENDVLPENLQDAEDGFRKYWDSCQKHPGHPESVFIPAAHLSVEHLPAKYFKFKEIFALIKIIIQQTVILKIMFTSSDRPDGYPCTTGGLDARGKFFPRRGSGWVSFVDADDRHTSVDEDPQTCPCRKCSRSGNPVLEWGEFTVRTATHVVFDSSEAAQTLVELTAEDAITKLGIVHGLRADYGVEKEDYCEMTCITHDLALFDRLLKLQHEHDVLQDVLWEKFGSELTDDRLCIMVSHPHGQGKFVTIGEWTERKDTPGHDIQTQYTYTTASCPGSSGAPLFLLGKLEGGWFNLFHPHSGGTKIKGLNRSALGVF